MTNPRWVRWAGWCLAASAALGAAGPAGAATATLRVGTLTLTFCNARYGGYCGSIERPLDPSGSVAGTVTVGFEYYPRTARSGVSAGTILPQEGGPGYSTTGSRDFYLPLFAPLRDERDVLLVDKRGTGYSGAIDCPALQNLDPPFLAAVGQCGRQLDDTAFYYGTAFAAGDVVAVLDALQIGRVDFYGDSYGTFVGQVLAALHPSRLRSVVLDSAYPVRAPDPWFATDWAKAWRGIDLSCERSPSCAVLGGRATARVASLLDDVRAAPIRGTAPDGDGVPQAVTLDTSTLFFTIDSAGYGPTIYRDLDAATRAWFDAGDAAPLLRLVAESYTGGVSDPVDFSEGLYTAVSCSDYPLLYDLRLPLAERTRQYRAALDEARIARPDLFAPFSLAEALASQTDITPLDTCLPWPRPPAAVVQGQPIPAGVAFPAVPTLVLSGDLDSVTSPTDAAEVTAQWPGAVHLLFPNLPHVVAGTDEIGCTSGLVLEFVRTLRVGDTSCAPKIRPIRTVPRFARASSELAPLAAAAGNRASSEDLQMAASALEAVGDTVARWWVSYSGSGAGLRGGAFSYRSTDAGYRFTLDEVEWTTDVAVSGTVAWNTDTSEIVASVSLARDGRPIGALDIRWTDADVDATAQVNGTIGGRAVRASQLAP